MPSTFCPPAKQNAELEGIINTMKHINVHTRKVKNDNIKDLRNALASLIKKTNNKIIIKPADKGDIIVIMSPHFYLDMCMKELSNTEYYEIVGGSDPTPLIKEAITMFATRYRDVLTPNEFSYITERRYSMAKFYMLPKLHKSEYLNSILGREQYIHLKDFSQQIDGRPIVGGPSFYTSGLSEMIDIILQPLVKLIPHIVRNSFDLLERINTETLDDVSLGTCDIKSLYTNISQDLALKAIDYWITRYSDSIPLLQRFSKSFVLNALRIILEYNYFTFYDFFVKQIKGFAMGTKAAVCCANLVVAFLEVTMFSLLPSVYPNDVVDFIIRNYFRFLDDLLHQWLKNFDVSQFYQIFDGLDPDLKFIFSNLSSEANYLDIHFKIVGNNLEMDIYRKPTDSCNYLNYHSCHPKHTRDNIGLALAKRIVRIVSHDRDARLTELRNHLMARDYPTSSISYAFSGVFTPKREPCKKFVVFTSTYNPRHAYDSRIISNCLSDLKSPDMQMVFGEYKVILGTRQPKSLRSYLVRSSFKRVNPTRDTRRKVGFVFCQGVCKYHRLGYCIECLVFTFGSQNRFSWSYNRLFDCNSRNVIYVVKCHNCWMFYIGETEDLKARIRLHLSNVHHPTNANCKKLSNHLRRCSGLVHPYFTIHPFYYVENRQFRRFMEKRFVQRYNPPLNGDK